MVEVLKGNLAQLSLLDIIKMFNAGRRTGRLDIHQGSKTGEIYLQNGNLVHAVTGTQLGEAGLYTLLGWLMNVRIVYQKPAAPLLLQTAKLW